MDSSSTPESDQTTVATAAALPRKAVVTPDFSVAAQPISQFTPRVDYPACLLGVHIDIRGFSGVVVEIVNQSIRVLSPDGIMQSFNFNRLKTLNAPPDHFPPMPSRNAVVVAAKAEVAAVEVAETVAEPELPERVYIEDPDFSVPFQKIDDFASQPDFPQCVYGKHVDIRDYTGVVIEIVKGSLKVQSREGVLRSYNAGVLKKLYGGRA